MSDNDKNRHDVKYGSANDEAQSGTALLLVVLSVLGVGVGYAASVTAARILGPAAFENYAVAIAALGLLATLAEAGVGKYALKVMPGFTAAEQWSLASGYWRYSLRATLVISIVLAAGVVLWEGVDNNELGSYPLGIAAFFLPAAALAGVGVDFVMANRAAVAGTLIARLVVPATTLMLLIAAGTWLNDVSGGIAVICFGMGSFVGVVLCGFAFRRTSPPQIFSATPESDHGEWLRECGYFMGISFLMSWILRISIVILELLPVPESEVGYFAAALETGCLILLLSKSTDKLFQPEMSVIVQNSDRKAGIRLRNRRYAFVGSGCAVFMSIMIFRGRDILGLYGAEFRAGYASLCFVSAGTCTWTMFSLAPVYLRFAGRSAVVISTTVVGAVMMAVLTTLLGIRYGATGAGIAFCIVLCTVSGCFLFVSTREFFRQDDSDTAATDRGHENVVR
jgi:O-antigen/teichoic acid export membrane protein